MRGLSVPGPSRSERRSTVVLTTVSAGNATAGEAVGAALTDGVDDGLGEGLDDEVGSGAGEDDPVGGTDGRTVEAGPPSHPLRMSVITSHRATNFIGAAYGRRNAAFLRCFDLPPQPPAAASE